VMADGADSSPRCAVATIGKSEHEIEREPTDRDSGKLSLVRGELAEARRELEHLNVENAALRQQVVELSVEVDSRIVVSHGHWITRCPGIGVLLHAPYDLGIVFLIKLLECIGYFGFSYIYMEYASSEFGLSDKEAGLVYSLYGLLCTVLGLTLGLLIDRLGVRRSMMLGCVCSTLYRFTCFATTSKTVFWVANVTIAPVGAAFGVPVLALGVRRYTHDENRAFAFSFFYAALNLACVSGSMLINLVRDFVGTEGDVGVGSEGDVGIIAGYRITWMRTVVLCTAIVTACTVPLAYFVRDIQIDSTQPLEEMRYNLSIPAPLNVKRTLAGLAGESRFWRLAGVTLIFCGVRTTFRHLDATFPKYFLRTYGPQAPFEMILCINPVITMILSPIVTGIITGYKWSLSHTLLIGAFVSGFSAFVLAAHETYIGAIAFVAVLSLGEATWSPKLYEFSTMSAPEGREGMYVAITAAPMYLASVPVGVMSGWMLKEYCPRDTLPEDCQGAFIWFLIGIGGFTSPALLWIFRSRLFTEEDESPQQKRMGGVESIPLSEGVCMAPTSLSAVGAEDGDQEDDDPEEGFLPNPAPKTIGSRVD